MLYRVAGDPKIGYIYIYTTWALVRGRTVGTYSGDVPWYGYGTGIRYGGTVSGYRTEGTSYRYSVPTVPVF